MKLLSHNVLSSQHIKGVKEGFPLKIEAKDVKVCEVQFNKAFVARLIPKLKWPAIVQAARQLGHADGLPDAVVDDFENDEAFLKKAHHVLMEIDIINGSLVCPETGRKFPITDGIPSMILDETETTV